MATQIPASQDILCAHEVAFAYRKDAPVLKQVSVEIQAGSFLAILGVNGSGKSTFLACLDDLLTPDKGQVLLADTPLTDYSRRERAQHIAFVAQHSHANRLTVYDAVLLGRMPFIKTAPTSEDQQIVEQALEKLDLLDYALRYVSELSGGEYQKVILARALAQQSKVLLLDEPTNNLDPANQQEVMRIIRTAVDEEGVAAAAVLHDMNLALRYCDRFVTLKDGSVASYGGSDTLTEKTIEHVYGIDVDIIEHNGQRVVVPR